VEREYALFINQEEKLHYLTDTYRRVYFGDEFCERLLPGSAELIRVMEQVSDAGRSFTLVTPYVTEAGLEQVGNLLKLLSSATEVVFNDWGVFRLLRRDYPDLVPVMGRLLTKIKRGPRIMNFLDTLPPAALSHFRTSNLDVPRYQRFLEENNICRAELDNPLQGLDLSGVSKKLHLSLYIPFAYVTTTRFCLTANADKPDKKGFIGVFPCKRECRTYTFYLDNAAMTTLLVRRGNTIFFRNTDIPEDIRNSHLDRVVVSPEIPH
jgi:hypothetical protein